jgi:AcrR family transcriptional regulator
VSEPEREPIRRLRPGPHGLPPELVERNQRERLIAAMAEVCGERGYVESSVAEIAKRAGVSTASFYRQFEGRRACMLASFEELFGRLLEAIEDACPADAGPEDRARAGACVASKLLAGDPPTARLLSVEILAVGAEGVRAQHEAIEHLAALVSEPVDDPPLPSPDAAWAVAAAMVSLVGLRAAQGESPDAAQLEALAALL